MSPPQRNAVVTYLITLAVIGFTVAGAFATAGGAALAAAGAG